MKTFCFINYYRNLLRNSHLRQYCTTNKAQDAVEKIRNIGILAHIDAGKTTTTERMLYYSGTIMSMGEVHHGNTVTDYMEQERQRGITITSAAVTFPWRDNQINLIDTPGHIDFTMEVEQSLAVLDGAIVVLDGSAGVEAQTLTVWRQASGYRVPRIIYLNKMDRWDASVDACIHSVQNKLDAVPLLLHIPVRYEDRLIGLIDLITLEEIIWTQGRGKNYVRRKLTEKDDGAKWEKAMENYSQLIDTVSTIDDRLAEIIIQEESIDNLKPVDIIGAVRRCTLQMHCFPVLCGSSYKNIGVQTLLDGVVSYLPSPLECSEMYKCFGSDLAAKVFKVQHDDHRGVLTFMRLYSGEITKGQKIYNLAQQQNEQTGTLYEALADDFKPVEKVTAGNIAVVSYLKTTMCGDLITSTSAAASRAKSRLSTYILEPKKLEQLLLPNARQKLQTVEEELSTDEKANIMLGIGTTVPDPVFICTIEPPSLAYQNQLETALAELQREDPSLRVTMDNENGQIVLAGMGELHLEIIKERIIREYKIDVELGPLQIAYQEALVGTDKHTLVVDKKMGSVKQMVKITMSAKNVPKLPQDKVLRLDKSQDSASNLAHIYPRTMKAIEEGVQTALLHGPKLGCPVVDVQVTLHWLEVGRGTSDSVITASVVQCLRKVFDKAQTVLLEPVMSLEVVCPESYGARVMADLTRRRAEIQYVHVRNQTKVIDCLAPLSELLGYSTTLRSISSGLASFTMEFHSHRKMSPYEEEKAVNRYAGM